MVAKSNQTAVDRPWRDSSWFPVDLDVARSLFLFMGVSGEQIARSVFLDNRLDVDWSKAQGVPLSEVVACVPAAASTAWLWHTSFCGSTLLARALDLPPFATVLREPLVLRRLSDASAQGMAIDLPLSASIDLLGRSWHPAGKVLVKPTHAALNIARRIATVRPADRVIVLTSSLQDFLLSNIKKSPETQAKAATLAERALGAGDFVRKLSSEAFNPPDTLCAAALQWAAQRELAAGLCDAATSGVRVVDSRELFANLPEVAMQCQEWLRLDLPAERLFANCAAVGQTHAKAPLRTYDNAMREREKKMLRDTHAAALGAALAWAGRHVLPRMSGPALSMSA